MTPQLATLADVPDLARIHVQAWSETYAGLLPPEEIARRDLAVRQDQWTNQIIKGHSRIALVPGLGFAQAGPQRDPALAAAGWHDELYALYLLRAGQGRGFGRALFAAVMADLPATALVLEGNTPACRFYEASGARLIEIRDEHVGLTAVRERVYGWGVPVSGDR